VSRTSKPPVKAVSDDEVRALLARYRCPVPFHAVRTRFLGNIASPVMSASPLDTLKGPCQVYVLGTSNGCIVGRDYQGIETLSRPDFPLRLFNLTTPILRFPGESRVLVPAAMEGTGETDFPRGARGIRTAP